MRSKSRRVWAGCGRVKFSRRIGVVVLTTLLLAALLLPSTIVHSDNDGPNLPPENPYLADSAYAMSHGDSAQQDSTGIPGPTGPTMDLCPLFQVNYKFMGPAHFGIHISSPYPDGRRVMWSNGGDRIVKLDHDTFNVLATYELPVEKVWTNAQAEGALFWLNILTGPLRILYSLALAQQTLMGLSGVYALLDIDGNFYVGSTSGITVYGDAVEGDPDSEIAILDTWALPAEITGELIGMNMTYDGWLILVTDEGWVMALNRDDLNDYRVVKMLHSEGAAAYNEQMRAEGHVGYGWVRNGYAIDNKGGIYIVSKDHMHKVVWHEQQQKLYAQTHGAWTAEYLNGWGFGSGANPSLMGFGDEDKFVVIADGEELMNVVLFWRDEIPEGWVPPAGAPSDRIAGMLPADMGDPTRTAIQSEQSVVVAGYGAAVVNNEPASVPGWLPEQAIRLLSGFLGSDPAFTPYGVQKFEWDPVARELQNAWVNSEISSPNCVPYVSYGSNMFYTVGVRNQKWYLEGLDWSTGESVFHWKIGLAGERFNSLYSGVHLDQNGRIIYGTIFGKVRLQP